MTVMTPEYRRYLISTDRKRHRLARKALGLKPGDKQIVRNIDLCIFISNEEKYFFYGLYEDRRQANPIALVLFDYETEECRIATNKELTEYLNGGCRGIEEC